jgi:cell division cycle protein 37
MVDYSKWKNIEVSDDEDDTHPNIDTPSLFRWRHQARVERMEKEEEEKATFLAKQKENRIKLREAQEKMKNAKDDNEEKKKLKKEIDRLKKQEENISKEEEVLKKKERLTPWNVDTLSKDGFSHSVINKPQPKKELTEEEKHAQLQTFVERHEKEIKHFGMLHEYDDSRDYLRDHPHLVCEETASYLTLWCVTLQVEEKTALMERVAHQAIVMQYILQLAKQLERDPRSCVPGFFQRLKTAEKQYSDSFEDELQSFIERVKARARIRIEEATKKVEEEERQQRLGPGGLDPVEVMETLPADLRSCFENRDIPKLQEVLSKMNKEDAAYHMRRCIDSGLWVADAKSSGLTPAKEELKRYNEEHGIEEADASDEEEYEDVDD